MFTSTVTENILLVK